jgi:hypothetical protein
VSPRLYFSRSSLEQVEQVNRRRDLRRPCPRAIRAFLPFFPLALAILVLKDTPFPSYDTIAIYPITLRSIFFFLRDRTLLSLARASAFVCPAGAVFSRLSLS